MYYVETSTQGTKYAVSIISNRKRALTKAEWTRIRKAERLGLKVPLVRIGAAELKAIPNA